MKRLVFELILIVGLAVVSYKYYDFQKVRNQELRQVYQMLIESEEIAEKQHNLIRTQKEVIFHQKMDILTLEEECDRLFNELPIWKQGKPI